ncbi:hypothetical protein BRARA_C00661, partial [Brassica rapa]
ILIKLITSFFIGSEADAVSRKNAMGRNLHTASLQGVYSAAELSPSKDESVRKMMELMDYQPVESNTNWNGFVATPPPQSPPLS